MKKSEILFFMILLCIVMNTVIVFHFSFYCLLTYFQVPGQISVFARGSEVVSEGGNVFLHCNASAYPKPTVSWSKLNADYFTVVESSWLNFTNIRRDEAGDYVCVANNTCGTRKSSRRTIDVQCKGVYINYYHEAS